MNNLTSPLNMYLFYLGKKLGLQFLVNWAGVTKGGTNLNAWKAVAVFSVIGGKLLYSNISPK